MNSIYKKKKNVFANVYSVGWYTYFHPYLITQKPYDSFLNIWPRKYLLQGQITGKYGICLICGRGPYTTVQSRNVIIRNRTKPKRAFTRLIQLFCINIYLFKIIKTMFRSRTNNKHHPDLRIISKILLMSKFSFTSKRFR